MHQQTLAQLASGLREKQFSSQELTQHFLSRIQKFDTTLNSFITVDAEVAMEQAQLADRALAQGQQPLFTGIPIAHKDIFCTQGMKTTCASKMLHNFVSPYDATIIQKLRQQNSIILGKTNMDEFAMGSSNENSFYGAVSNPWQHDHVPGGSSGGSAACVAARIAPIATGSDTGGSVRQPAAFCGITGFKPTYGVVSRYGMVAYASSFDQAGILSQTAEDAALLLEAIAGDDEADATALPGKRPQYSAQLSNSIRGLRIGLPKEFFSTELSSEISSCLEDVIQTFRDLGAELVEISLPATGYSIPCYYVLAPAEASSNLSRFDGVRYGYRAEHVDDLNSLYKRSRSEAFGDEVKRRIMVGTYVLSSGYYDAYYNKALKVRNRIKEDFKQAFEKVDVILGPTSPTTAFKKGEKLSDPISMYQADVFTIAANLAGLPAISCPAGFVNNLPIGMQLIGNANQDGQVLHTAHQFQTATEWHLAVPSIYL